MLMMKKAKIQKYLEMIKKTNWSTFDLLLSHYIDGELSIKLQQIGINKPQVFVNFLDEYKCIGIQGKHKRNYVDIQIEETEYSIGCDPEEPDNHDYYPLISEELFYLTISEKLKVF